MSTQLKTNPINEHEAGNRETTSSVTLLGATTKMDATLSMLESINLKANFIALNAAIEAARSQSQTENFALVADQISRQAQRAEELAEKLRHEIQSLQRCALRATAVRYADIASDIIDKIDRNLFERNCDCQAWATFESVVTCAKQMQGKSSKDVAELLSRTDLGNSSRQAIDQCNEQLQILMSTYQVYDDVFVMNESGVIIASAKRRELIGSNYESLQFFRDVRESKKVVVTDMHLSPHQPARGALQCSNRQ
jgi:hypothetical protein